MQTEIIVGLIGLLGIVFGSFPTYLYMRKRNIAELDKLQAETDKTRAETEKIRAEQQSSKINEIDNKNLIELPKEFSLSFSARREALTQSQGGVLKYISNMSYAGQYISQDSLELEFNQYNSSELFYRLENLRLLNFVEKQKTGKDIFGTDRFSYRISERYKKEIGNPDTFYQISAST